jgi:hypothetical protein
MSDKHAAEAVDTEGVASTASSFPKNENSQAQLQPQTDSSSRTNPHADPGLGWGITPSTNPDDQKSEPGPDHPVHKIPLEKQEKMRQRGVNLVLWAEMNVNRTGERGFWSKVAGTSMGGGWIK